VSKLRNRLWFLALLLLLFCLTEAMPRAERGSSKDKIQLIYREQADGRWQVSVYGTVCEDMMVMHLKQPDQPVIEPFVVSCDHPKEK